MAVAFLYPASRFAIMLVSVGQWDLPAWSSQDLLLLLSAHFSSSFQLGVGEPVSFPLGRLFCFGGIRWSTSPASLMYCIPFVLDVLSARLSSPLFHPAREGGSGTPLLASPAGRS